PIIQAPMAGGGDTPRLVAALSEAGALGSIGAAYLSPQQIAETARAVRGLTSRPFGINLFAPVRPARLLPFLQLSAGEAGVVTVQALRQRRAHQRFQLFELG